MNRDRKKYGFTTAVSMVVGSVIGSGIFFKAETLSRITAGNALEGVMAWILGGGIMLLCLLSFSLIASKYDTDGGIVQLSKSLVGKNFAYYTGWFMAVIYYPSLTSVLGWLSARYTLLYFGADDFSGGLCMILSCLFLVISFGQNVLSPAFSGKFQVVTVIIKLIPLFLISLCGIPYGIRNGIFSENFYVVQNAKDNSLFPAISNVLFAYEGWIVASSIGNELENPKRLSAALITGGIITVSVYVLYYVGIMCSVKAETLINYGVAGIRMAYKAVLGRGMGKLLTAFVAISCLGALNGMMMGMGRSMYEIAMLGKGPYPKLFSHINPVSGTPVMSFIPGLIFSVAWLFFLFGSSLSDVPIFKGFSFDCTRMPITTLYLFYIPIFVTFIKKHGREKKVNVLLPLAGILACVFTLICAIASYYADALSYLYAFLAIMLLGSVFYVT